MRLDAFVVLKVFANFDRDLAAFETRCTYREVRRIKICETCNLCRPDLFSVSIIGQVGWTHLGLHLGGARVRGG